MASTSPSRPRRTVLTLCTGGQPRDRHEHDSQAWVASRLAAAAGWAFGGEHDPQRPRGPAYWVPDETLTTAQAASLGITGEDDLFGGVVPHGFVASKVISHPLAAGSGAPDGWVHALADALAGAVLPGASVFDPDAIEPAGLSLLALGGPIRLKEARARGGNGQHLVADAAALRHAVATLDPATVRRDGVVLEQHLEGASTLSVGEIRFGATRLAYLGTQAQVRDREGHEVYGGSRLRVVRGGLEALAAVATDTASATALELARRYDAAVSAAWPGFFASRRNYDVIAGHDPGGRWRCGVLEQSWRLGGASPAEMVALAAFLRPGAERVLDVACLESHSPDPPVPPGAQVHFHDPGAARGPTLKYAVLAGGHGHPA